MYFTLAFVLGFVSIFFINTSLLPQTKERWIIVSADYKGVKAKEIRKLIAMPLEESLSSLKDLKNCESICRDGFCLVKIELKWNSDANRALLETNSLIDSAMESLPEDCSRPFVKIHKDNSGKIKLFIIPKGDDILSASDFAQNELKNKLLSVEECAELDFYGLQKKMIKIVVDYKKSAFYNLSLEDIARDMNNSNFDYPAGSIQDGDKEMIFKSEGAYKNRSDILNTFIKTTNEKLRLKDIAKIHDSIQKESSFCFYNGKPCIEATLLCKKNKNPLKFSCKIKRIVKNLNLKKTKPQIIISQDSSDEIKKVLLNLFASSAAGILISFALILFFFRSGKIACLIACSIPFCVLFSFLVLTLLGRSANIISLTGITICLGMVLDNSIVAIESVLENNNKEKNFSENLKASIENIFLSNKASTITTIIAFVPIFFIGGIIGELFIDLGISVFAGMLFSLIYSFTFLPASCVLFLEEEIKKTKKITFKNLENKYYSIIKKTNKKKFLCPAISAFSLVLCFFILIPIKKELQPKEKENNFLVQVSFEPGSGFDFLKNQGKEISKKLLKIKSIKNISCKGGIEKNDFETLSNPANCEENITFCIESDKIKKTFAECQKIFNAMNLKYLLEEKSDLICERLSIKNHSLIAKDNPDDLLTTAKFYFGTDFAPNYFKNEKKFVANKHYMRKNKLSPLELSKALKYSFDGCETLPFYEAGDEIKMQVQYKDEEFSSENKLALLKIFGQDSQIGIEALGHWENSFEESLFYRHNGKDAKIISEKKANKASQKERDCIVFLRKDNTADFLKNAFCLTAISFILLYCILGAQTESFLKPLIYFVALPPAILGAIIFLTIFRSSLNINSAIALAALLGMSVNNSILLHEGGVKKFSSALITTITSLAALIPFAFDPFNINPQSSLSLAICGGLLFSSAASFILIPNIKERKNESF